MSRMDVWIVWFSTLVLVVSTAAESFISATKSPPSTQRPLKKNISSSSSTRLTSSRTSVSSSSTSSTEALVSTSWPSTTKSLLGGSRSRPFSHSSSSSHSVFPSSTFVPSKHASSGSSVPTSSRKVHSSSTRKTGFTHLSQASVKAKETISHKISTSTSLSSRRSLNRSFYSSSLSMRHRSSLRIFTSTHDFLSSSRGESRPETTIMSIETRRSTSTKPNNTSTPRTSLETDSSKVASTRSAEHVSPTWNSLAHFSSDLAASSTRLPVSYLSLSLWSRSSNSGPPFLGPTTTTVHGNQSYRAPRPSALSESTGGMRVSKRPLKTPPGTRYAFLNTDSLLLPETTKTTSAGSAMVTSTISTVMSSIPNTMPLTIDPENKQATRPTNDMLISILFKASLSWTWISVQRGTSAQVFTYMPEIVAHALSIQASDVKTIQLRRYEQQEGNDTVQRTLYLAYIPKKYGDPLQHLIANRTSMFYSPDGDRASRELAQEVDPASNLFLFATQPDDDVDNSMPVVTRNALLGSFVGVGGAVTLGIFIWFVQRHLKKKSGGSSLKLKRSDSILSFGNDSPDPYLDRKTSTSRHNTCGSFFAGDSAGSSADVFQRQQGVTGIINVGRPDKPYQLCRTRSCEMDSLDELQRKRSVPTSPLPGQVHNEEGRISSISVYAMDLDKQTSHEASTGEAIHVRTRGRDLASQVRHT